MKEDGAKPKVILGETHQTFSPNSEDFKYIFLNKRKERSPVEDLRAAIYQFEETTNEMKKLKKELVQLKKNS